MRRALIGMIMAATVLSPVAAGAQDFERGGRSRAGNVEHRSQSQNGRRDFDSNDSSPQRQERQQARQQARSERRAARPERAPAQVQQAPAQASQPAAVAQSPRGRRGGGGGNGERAARPGSIYPQAWQGNASERTRQRYEQLERRNQWRYGTEAQRDEIRQERRDRDGDGRGDRNGRGDRDGRDWNRGDGDRRDWRGDRGRSSRDWSREWNRGWRNDNRYNWSDWRHRYRNRYRLGHYYSPYRNWAYSRFSIGVFLQPLFYGQNYWIGDPYYYRLPPAPPGTQWVRYYNDVLLVDVYSGQVVDVIYNFFW